MLRICMKLIYTFVKFQSPLDQGQSVLLTVSTTAFIHCLNFQVSQKAR